MGRILTALRPRSRWVLRCALAALCVPLVTGAAMLVLGLGGCSGGLKVPIDCAHIPGSGGAYVFVVYFLGLLVSMVWVPAWLLAGVCAEIWTRIRARACDR